MISPALSAASIASTAPDVLLDSSDLLSVFKSFATFSFGAGLAKPLPDSLVSASAPFLGTSPCPCNSDEKGIVETQSLLESHSLYSANVQDRKALSEK